jgi:hypothetical protein
MTLKRIIPSVYAEFSAEDRVRFREFLTSYSIAIRQADNKAHMAHTCATNFRTIFMALTGCDMWSNVVDYNGRACGQPEMGS